MTTWKIEVGDEGDDEEVVSFDLNPIIKVGKILSERK